VPAKKKILEFLFLEGMYRTRHIAHKVDTREFGNQTLNNVFI
jgi:hypothetical protein